MASTRRKESHALRHRFCAPILYKSKNQLGTNVIRIHIRNKLIHLEVVYWGEIHQYL